MKKSIIITLFLLSILMIGAVNASENVTNDISTSDVTDDSISQTDNNEINQVDNEIDNKVASSNNEPIKEDYKETSFKALNKLINEATTETINLKHDYTYDESSDSDFKNGITISKSITINGNGKTIDAQRQGRIFQVINGATLTLENMTLINGKATTPSLIADGTTYGGAIYGFNATLNITNCNFNNNTGDYGGAISQRTFQPDGKLKLYILNCTFTQNTATKQSYDGYGGYGGAVYTKPESSITEMNITNSNFRTNNAIKGSAIYTVSYANIHNCTFIDNNVVCEYGNVDLSDSTIINSDNPTQPDNPTNNDTENNGNNNNTETNTENNGNNNNTETNTENNGNNNNTETNTGNNGNNNQNTNTPTNPTTGSTNTQTNKQTIKITAPTKATFKAKAKTKKYSATIKNKNKPIKKATVKLTVKGKKYTVRTNNKGKATFKITNLKKKGKYTAVITYKGIKRTVKIIVK